MKVNSSSLSALGLAWELGYIIALPLIAFSLGGKALDTLLNSSPLFFLIGIICAVTATSVLVYRKVRDVMEDIESEEKKDDTV